MTSVLQEWVQELPMMQQSVLLTAVRGPDGLPKYHSSKYLLRWYRRSILLSALDGRALADPVEPNGGSFTGPSVFAETDSMLNPSGHSGPMYVASGGLRDGTYDSPPGAGFQLSWQEAMNDWVSAYLRDLDEVPHHFQLHFLHGAEIIGYKHPEEEVGDWWEETYLRLVTDMHLSPEREGTLDYRLGDSREQWLDHADRATRH